MTILDPAVLLVRLAEACARIRAAAHPDDVLDAAADEARAITGAQHAWAARLENGAIASLRRTSVDGVGSAEPAAPTLAAMLANARPIARADGFIAATLRGSSDAPEGILAVEQGGTSADGAADLVLGHLAVVAGLALEAARLRARVDAITKAREALFASVSHDLRNPLNTFAMSAGLLRDDLERDDVDATRGISLVSRMERATSRMQSLIEDLVEASRIDAHKVDYALREEPAAQLVKDAAAAATSAAKDAKDKCAAVALDTLDEDARVVVDRSRTLQLLSKVIAFEAKATGDGGTIRLGVERQGDVVVFTARAIGPSGTPVPPPAEGRGGLALLIARGLVEAQRGAFRIEPGDGLVVSLTLPAATA